MVHRKGLLAALAGLTLVLYLLAGCGPVQVVVVTSTPPPTAAVLVIIVTPVPPTDTPVPTATPTTAPTSTPTLTPTSLPTATPIIPPTPTLAPLPAMPTYSQVVATYPAGADLCATDADITGGDDSGLQLSGTISMRNMQFVYQCYGTKLTVKVAVTLQGKTYQPGALLTVDAALNWIEVSSWQ